jgi:hypothetical protein
MQTSLTSLQADQSVQTVRVVSKNGKYAAEFLTQADNWMVGTIVGKQLANDSERGDFITAVMDCIEEVSEDEQTYSTCTDGRKRLRLDDGNPVPVREQLLGTDTMSAFVAAESLGAHFYGDDLYAPVAVRIAKVVDFMMANNYHPTAHISCGAAGGFTTVINRATQFIKDPAYISRMRRLTDGAYNDTLHHLIVGSYQSRLVSGVYEGYRDGLVAEIVLAKVGPHAVEHYEDDNRGVHGHREQAIVYLDQSMQGLALNPNGLIEQTGSQVFGINASRADAIAHLMSGDTNSGTQGIDYLTARLAIEDFACAGHGTLATSMQTIVVSRAA